MLQHNSSLEKLLIQHNYVETSGAQHIVHAIKNHTKIKYLDISANEIHSQGFLYFTELF
jgi:Ran GTPase-activating protein (RanGAP) involved in mRNA processing and transport